MKKYEVQNQKYEKTSYGNLSTARWSDCVYWTAWTGGQVQVGNGNFLNVTHRGVVIVYARCMRTGKTCLLYPSPSPRD